MQPLGQYLDRASLHALINLKKWKSLGQAQQDLLSEVGLEFEVKTEASSSPGGPVMKKQKDWMASEGMETITMEGADRSKWSAAASDAGWGEVLDRSPEHGAALKKLFTK